MPKYVVYLLLTSTLLPHKLKVALKKVVLKVKKFGSLFTYLFKNHSKKIVMKTVILLITERDGRKSSIEFLKCDKSNDRNAKNLSKKLQKYTVKKLKKCRPFYQNQFSDEKSFCFASFSGLTFLEK